MLLIYVLLVLHTALAYNHHHYHRKVYYRKDDAMSHFQWFMKVHNKTYQNELEKATRFNIFQDNLVKINEMNENDPHSTSAINHFTDLSTEEFLQKYTGLLPKQEEIVYPCRILNDFSIKIGVAPKAFDWRDKIHFQIKNQMSCQSCWAFSATGNVEAQYAIKYKRSISLSEQQIVDCDTDDNGCQGGRPAHALRYLIQSGGQELEKVYPYIGKDTTCQFTPGEVQVRLTDCINFQLSNEDMIKEVLFKYGPLTAAINSEGVQSYAGGVKTNCSSTYINHAVLIVGYGRDQHANKDFWVIKNSWGRRWGEGGFARIERGVNACGILNDVIGTSVIS